MAISSCFSNHAFLGRSVLYLAPPALLLGLSGCLAEDETESSEPVGESSQAFGDPNVQPKSGTPGDWVSEPNISGNNNVFLSKRDNPVLRARIDLRPTQETQVNPAEKASATIRYRLTLTPFPFSEMTPVAANDDSSGSADHWVYGTRLSGAQNSIVGLMRDDWDGAPYSEGATAFRLHPDVQLKDIRVVSFYVSNPKLTRIKKGEAEYVFDDQRVYDIDVHTTPNESPADIIMQDITTIGFHTRPDSIWTQCDIQWRMTKYFSCAIPIELFQNDEPGDAGCPGSLARTGRARALIDAANDCAGAAKAGERTAIFFGGFENPLGNCPTTTTAAALGNDVLMTVGASGSVLAHELGHTLGLDDLEGAANQDRLMFLTGQGTELPPSDCTIAREHDEP